MANPTDPPAAPDGPASPDELPLTGGFVAPQNVVPFGAGVFPRGIIERPRPSDCSHPTYRIDDDQQKVFCRGCGKELSAFQTLRRLTREDSEREQRIAYEERMVQQRKEADKAIRRNIAAKRFKGRQATEAAKLQVLLSPGVSEEKARKFFSGVKAKIGDGAKPDKTSG